MSLPETIAHYKITGKLGAGGMGEVYRATDTKLGRDVAIKVLPAAFADDAARMARFEREAQVLAALNHPNIAAIYGVEQGALVMELVEGEDLRGPVPVETAVNYARQIAVALEAAHEKGIVHRDLKPANIKVTPDGVVKLLDFGLAAANTNQDGGSATVTISLTQAGMILGTAAYMSPEQARGKPVDKRADIWAFGVVLFEMLTGKQLYGGGETMSDSLAAVITKEPDWTQLPKETPGNIRKLLERCLRKDPKTRLRDIGEARVALDEPDQRAGESPVPPSPRRRWLPWAVAGLAVAVATVGWWPKAKPAEPPAARFLLTLPEGTTQSGSPAAPQVVPSPDGRLLAFIAHDAKTGKEYLRIQALGSLSAQKLEKTETASFPFWSPDGQNIGFFAERKLKRVAVAGGSVQTILDGLPSATGIARVPGDGGAWNREGVIVFASGPRSPLMRVAAAGGVAAPLFALDTGGGESGHTWPQFLPDGKHILYFARSDDPAKSGIYIHEMGSPRRTLVINNRSRGAYASPGYLIYAREQTLFAHRLNMKSLQVEGEPVPLAEEVSENAANGRAAFAVSETGVLVYRGGPVTEARQLTWYDREGKVLGIVGEPSDYLSMALSPDEKRAALTRGSARTTGNRKMWLMDLTTGILTPTAVDAVLAPVWSPDSQRVLAHSDGKGIIELTLASGATAAFPSDPEAAANDWSADGRFVIAGTRTGNAVSLLPMFGDRKPQIIYNAPFRPSSFRFSPDGKRVAYSSDETGTQEVFIAFLPNFTGKQRVSTGGAGLPIWGRDGNELFFLANGALMAAEVKGGTTIEVGVPKLLFRANLFSRGSQFAVARDGKRFLLNVAPETRDTNNIKVLVNWIAELKQ